MFFRRVTRFSPRSGNSNFFAAVVRQLETGGIGSRKCRVSFWCQSKAASATTCLSDWYRQVSHKKLKPVKAVVKLIKKLPTICVNQLTGSSSAS